MADRVIRATAAGGAIRAFAAVTTDMIKEAKEVHGLSPLASAALGRTMTAAALMCRTLKGHKDTLTIQIKGEGRLGGIVVISDSNANVRGYVYNPDVYLPLNERGKFDVSGAIGENGYLNVIKDLGLKEPYIGYVNLVSGEIAEDLAYYFASSEQVPSVVALGVLVEPEGTISNSGGYIIQLLPGVEEEIVEFLENKLQEIPPVTTLLADGKSPEDILELILGEKDMKIVENVPCRFMCNCSRERMERNVLSLGTTEIQNIIEEQQGAELQCHFCNKKYNFSEEELKNLINDYMSKVEE
ncbi:MAG: Hsp33 family molecular chaperone HslO [Clostridia bacterium]|nr:Hsp33 family molecular chaperone HslO [Clostridia bacterium]